MKLPQSSWGWPVNSSGTIVVLTPMSLEYQAVRAGLRGLRRVWHGTGLSAELGTAPGVPWQVAVAVPGEGPHDTAVLAERLIGWLRPVALLVVGVAGALRDDLAPGDVVVATHVYGVHGGRQDDAGSHARPRAWKAGLPLLQAAHAAATAGGWADGSARVHFKPVAAAEIVVDSLTAPLREELRRHYNDAVAVENESSGAASAAFLNLDLPALTVRGISDRADGRKRAGDAAGGQSAAAASAAAFALALLRELGGAAGDSAAASGVGLSGETTLGSGAPGGVAPGGVAPVGPAWRRAAAGVAPHRRVDQQSANGSAAGVRAGEGWQPLPGPLPARWLRELVTGPEPGTARLELYLIPASPDGSPAPARLGARRLEALPAELAALGWAQVPFGPLDGRPGAGQLAAAGAGGRGLAVTGDGQLSAWEPLPGDSLGAVLDTADATARLTRLLGVLGVLARAAPSAPERAGLAVGLTPAVPVSEGSAAGLPGRAAPGRSMGAPDRVPEAGGSAVGLPARAGPGLSATPVQVPEAGGSASRLPGTAGRGRSTRTAVQVRAVDTVALTWIGAAPGELAAELAARLLRAFRAAVVPGALTQGARAEGAL